MAILRAILGEFVGLFVDDGSLAVALLVWCAVVGAAMKLVPGLPAAGSGVALLFGCVAILLVNAGRTAKLRMGKR